VKARTVVLLFLYVIIVLCLIPVLLVCMLFRMKEPLYAIAKGAMRLSQWVLGINVEVDGLNNIDSKKSYVFMSNHLSFIDGPLLFMVIPHSVRIIFKKELFMIPVVGQAMTYVGFVPVDRKGVEAGKTSVKRAARLMREKRYSFLVFPEGTRSLDGELGKFRKGGFFLALESAAPIAPISIRGTFELMPKGSFFVQKGTIRVLFHLPLSIEGVDESRMAGLMETVRTAILAGLKEEKS
jgi:1-acyl-sn-glycerol-3-phosphate acyltransferase